MSTPVASGVLRIPLANGKGSTIVDADYTPSTLKWNILRRSRTQYAQRKVGKRTIRLHREIMETILGRPLEPDEQVDHINGFGLDNRRQNLRLATKAENGRNSRLRANNASGYKGVHWHKARQKWEAQIQVNRRTLFLGYYADPIDAARAYDAAARSHFGDFAGTNFCS